MFCETCRALECWLHMQVVFPFKAVCMRYNWPSLRANPRPRSFINSKSVALLPLFQFLVMYSACSTVITLIYRFDWLKAVRLIIENTYTTL